MVRKAMALLVSGAVWLGGINAALAQAASAPANPVPAAAETQTGNSTPLPPGGAAGIRQAQGSSDTIWHIIGLSFLGGVVLAMILVGNDEDDDSVTTTTTN